MVGIHYVYPRINRTFDKIASLQKCDLLRICQGHCILQIEVAFAIKIEALVRGLDDGSINEYGLRTNADQARRKVPNQGVGR